MSLFKSILIHEYPKTNRSQQSVTIVGVLDENITKFHFNKFPMNQFKCQQLQGYCHVASPPDVDDVEVKVDSDAEADPVGVLEPVEPSVDPVEVEPMKPDVASVDPVTDADALALAPDM